MNILKKFFLFNKKTKNKNVSKHEGIDHDSEIAKLVKESRIQKNLTIQELSRISNCLLYTSPSPRD